MHIKRKLTKIKNFFQKAIDNLHFIAYTINVRSVVKMILKILEFIFWILEMLFNASIVLGLCTCIGVLLYIIYNIVKDIIKGEV